MRKLTLEQMRAGMTAKPVLLYHCPICQSGYEHEADAIACAANTEMPIAEVGDIVRLHAAYGWIDGDEAWVRRKLPADERGSASGFMYECFFVITAIEQRETPSVFGRRAPHQLKYHVKSLAKEHAYGWTSATGHYCPTVVPADEVPGFVREQAKGLIGQVFENLVQ